MRLNAVKILGISVTNTSKKEILEEIRKYLDQVRKNTQKPLKIYTPNTEQLVLATRNSDFARVLNQADISLPDTVGVAWASRILTKNPLKTVIPGVEFMEDLVEMASTCHVPIGLIGGRDNLAVDTLGCLRQKYKILSDSWAQDGPEFESTSLPDDLYFQRLGRRIIREGTRIVFVSFGPPKQEYFIERLSREVHGVILMSVGGSFDIISGRLPRAPSWMRNFGLEWLWRLFLEPWRIRRQLALIEFVWLVLKEKLLVF
jgi:N-acetylglucosaminyldiphosphoundecaprenol N-acetyl-beta-D-mannosaminyltransferase